MFIQSHSTVVHVLFRLFVLKYTVVQLLGLYIMQCLEKELDLSGWIMCSAEHKIRSWRSVILLAGETIIADIQRMLVSYVEVKSSFYGLQESILHFKHVVYTVW